MTFPAIRVRELTRDFGPFRAVDHLSFEVPQGRIYGFLGPNGAGKTTTMRILAGLDFATDGDAEIMGKPVAGNLEEIRATIGYMADNFGVYTHMDVDEYLDFFARAHKLPAAERSRVIEDVIAFTGLGPLREKMVTTLSKGMRQRLGLARTLLHDPQVLLLDEPSAGLDPRARIELRALLQVLAERGKTVLISSHILKEIEEMCHGIVVIEQGRLVAAGAMNEVRGRANVGRTLYVKLSEDWDKAEALLWEQPGVTAVKRAPDRLLVAFQGDDEAARKINLALLTSGLPVNGFGFEEGDLEELFMRLTKGDVA